MRALRWSALVLPIVPSGPRSVALLALGLVACSPEPASAPIPKVEGAPPDVVVVTLDTVRADRIGAYGYKDGKTDTMDTLAAKGLRFEQAISPLPLTIPAHATMFTGLFPYRHGIRSNGDNVLAPTFTTLAESLKANGYATGASVAAFVTTRQWGFAQGFDDFYDQMPQDGDKNYWHTERDGAEVVDDALNWLADQPAEKPVFLWVHLYDAHFPYVPKGEHAEAFADKPYDGELAYVDDQVARLVDAFAGRRVLWSLIGDHGESLGEHNEGTHGNFTYQATQRVPWILSGEGVKPGVVTESVSTADLTPTILRTLGITIPDGLDGKPQPGSPTTPYAESWQLTDRFLLAPHQTVVSGNLKLVGTPKPELYDIAADPGELTNLADQRPEDVARLQALLQGLGPTPPSAESADLDAETVSQLAALGYVAGGGMGDVDVASLPDPKDHQPFLAGVFRLDRKTEQSPRGPEETLALMDRLLAMKPDAFELRMRRVPLLNQLGRADEARAYMEETANLFPTRARVWVTLAGMASEQRDWERAALYARRATEVEPRDPAGQESLVKALFKLGRNDEAIALGEGTLAENPHNYGVAALLGHHFLTARDFHKAERFLRIAVAGPNPKRAARVELAMLALAAGVRADGYTLLEAEIKDYPGNIQARKMLARLLAEDGRWLEEKEQRAFVARARPKDAEARLALAQAIFNIGDYPGARRELDVALSLAPKDPWVILLHANLLAKEGKRDEGYALYLEAQAMLEGEAKAGAAATPEPETPKPETPKPSMSEPGGASAGGASAGAVKP